MKTCSSDQVCISYYNQAYQCLSGTCQHNSLFPLTSLRLNCLILIFVISVLANAAAIGGGAIFIPLFINFLDFTIGDAIPLANVAVLAGGITTLFLTYNKRDPQNKNVLLIDYKLASFIIPLISAGTMIGVLFVKFFPPIFLLICLIVYIAITTNQMSRKAKALELQQQQTPQKDLKMELIEK